MGDFARKHYLTFYTFIFLGCFVIGWQVAKKSQWDGMVSFVPDGPRTPAATYRVFDFSHLDGPSLTKKLKQRILSEAIFLSDSEKVGLQLGHFISRSPLGNREMGCKLYDRIQLTLRSSAMANSGNPVTMEVEGPCLTSIDDVNTIAPLWIPMKKLQKEIEVNRNQEKMLFDSLSISIKNSGGQFPLSWSLYSAKLFSHRRSGSYIKIDSFDIHKILTKSLSFEWAAGLPEEL